MKSRMLAVLITSALVASPMTAFAQGGGGSGGGSGGASASGGATGGGANTGANSGLNNQQTNSQQSSKAQAIQDQRDAATTGKSSAPSQPGDDAVSGPGVGVGHSTNGRPIGTPGSGLGSPENPVDVRK
jgi:hypothetical protein